VPIFLGHQPCLLCLHTWQCRAKLLNGHPKARSPNHRNSRSRRDCWLCHRHRIAGNSQRFAVATCLPASKQPCRSGVASHPGTLHNRLRSSLGLCNRQGMVKAQVIQNSKKLRSQRQTDHHCGGTRLQPSRIRFRQSCSALKRSILRLCRTCIEPPTTSASITQACPLRIFEPLERLQRQHSVCKFSSDVMPPLDRGTMWSISSRRFLSS